MTIQVERLSQHLHQICLYWWKLRCISHIIKTKIKTDKISEKLSGKVQFADNIVDSLLKARLNICIKLGEATLADFKILLLFFKIKFEMIKLTASPSWAITCLSWTGTGSLALMLSVNQLTFSSRVCCGSSVSFSTFMAWAAVSYSVIMWVTLSLQYWKLITSHECPSSLSLSVSISLQFLHQYLNFVGFFSCLLLEENLQPKDIQFFNKQCLNIQCICHL